MLQMPRGGESARAVLLSVTLLSVLLGACQHRASVPGTVDGLYFIDNDYLSGPKLMLLERGLFELLDGGELLKRGTFEARDGFLRLTPVGAGTDAVLETTYAVVDGRLLLGVLRQTGGERHQWTSAALPAELLGQRPMEAVVPDSFRIDWDMKAGEWHFTSGARHVALDGVARFEHPARAGRLLPVFRARVRRDAGDDSVPLLEGGRTAIGMDLGVLTPFGLRASPEAPLVWNGERVRLRDPGAGSERRAGKLFDAAESLVYERRGDVVVTPWTVDLGPVGLTPVRADPLALAGTYVSRDEQLVVSTQPPPPRDWRDGLSFDVDPSEEARTCHYLPDVRGLVVRTLSGGHPGMNHWDKPYVAVCFALADGRVVRYRSSGGCGIHDSPKLDVFQRR